MMSLCAKSNLPVKGYVFEADIFGRSLPFETVSFWVLDA